MMGQGRPGRVLIVDDDEGIRSFIEMALSVQGYDVLQAADGAVALSIIEQAPPALILLDMRMPNMDGWEFARAYRARPGEHAPVVVLTAARDAAERAAQVAADAYLAKPFRLDDLYAVVAQHLGEA